MSLENTDDFGYPDGSLPSPWLPWIGGPPSVASGAVTVDPFVFGDATRPESVGPDSYCEIIFRVPLDSVSGAEAGIGVRLDSHTGSSHGYMLQADGPNLQLFKDFTTPLGAGGIASNVQGMRLLARGSTIEAYILSYGAWSLLFSETDADYQSAGFTGFWLLAGPDSPFIESFSWGLAPLLPVAARFFGRLEPVAYADEENGNVLRGLTAALMAPRETFEIARADDEHASPWGALLDPGATPAILLDWLGVFAGVELPPSATTTAEKRYRITQAAGRYRTTPRAVVEELQLVLEDTKTVYIGFFTPDEWHYTVGTLAAETPDSDAVDRAVQAQKPVGMLAAALTTDDWVWLFLAPTVVGTRATVDGRDSYVVIAPDYPTWQSVMDSFSDWQHVIDNDPDL